MGQVKAGLGRVFHVWAMGGVEVGWVLVSGNLGLWGDYYVWGGGVWVGGVWVGWSVGWVWGGRGAGGLER